jgi:hypothetical protein
MQAGGVLITGSFVTSFGVSMRVSGCVILSLETLPPGDPNGGVVYLRIVLSLEEASRLMGNS